MRGMRLKKKRSAAVLLVLFSFAYLFFHISDPPIFFQRQTRAEFPTDCVPVFPVELPEPAEESTDNEQNSELSDFLKTQSVRRETIDKYCRNQSMALPVFENGFSSIVIDRVNKVTYCPIYKSASTSWAITLLTLRGEWKANSDLNKVRDVMNRVFIKAPHQSGPQETENTIKFLIVRHPFARLVSAYRDKFEEANKYLFFTQFGSKMVQKYRPLNKPFSELEIHKMLQIVYRVVKSGKKVNFPDNPFANPYGPTFEEFVKYIVYEEPNDDHWRPYYIQCSLCYMQYDVILRFENLASDSNLFIEYLNKSNVISTRWENPTATGITNKQISCEYFSQISLDLGNKLLQKYNHDFKLFGYSPDEYLECCIP